MWNSLTHVFKFIFCVIFEFVAFFGDLLEVAKKDLHDMFVRTYGLLYQQNSQVFTTLFDDLRQYYRGSDLNLIDVVDGFFTTLLQKLFVLLHQQSTFDEAYLQCMSEHMDELKPFGMIPQRLGSQVKRAFVAARTFVQALSVGRDVIIEVSKVSKNLLCISYQCSCKISLGTSPRIIFKLVSKSIVQIFRNGSYILLYRREKLFIVNSQ